jgi:hypothetical protein
MGVFLLVVRAIFHARPVRREAASAVLRGTTDGDRRFLFWAPTGLFRGSRTGPTPEEAASSPHRTEYDCFPGAAQIRDRPTGKP